MATSPPAASRSARPSAASARSTAPPRASASPSTSRTKPANCVTAAIAAGATGVSGPSFFVGDSELAFASALTAAFDKAKARATALATRAGGTLGPALAIDEGEGPELTPQFDAKSAPASDCVAATTAPSAIKRTSPRCTGAAPPTKPGTSTVTATVHVVFALQ